MGFFFFFFCKRRLTRMILFSFLWHFQNHPGIRLYYIAVIKYCKSLLYMIALYKHTICLASKPAEIDS